MTTLWDAKQKKFEEAEAVRLRFEREITTIRDNRDLNPAAKARQMAAAWGSSLASLEKIKNETTELTGKRRTELQERVFGPEVKGSKDAEEVRTSYRQALAQAAQVKDQEEAETVLNRAKMTGDSLMLRAVGVVAYEKGWYEVGQDSATSLGQEELFSELVQIDGADNNGLQAKLMEGMAFTPPLQPREISRVSEFMARDIAAQVAGDKAQADAQAEAFAGVFFPS